MSQRIDEIQDKIFQSVFEDIIKHYKVSDRLYDILSDTLSEHLEKNLESFATEIREEGKYWYFEGDELVIKKGKWVIDRYKKHSQPQTKEGEGK